jgi:hypothetical protein
MKTKPKANAAPPNDFVQRMMELFAGHPDAHGTHGEPVKDGLKWDIKSTAKTIRRPVTLRLWQDHLSGKRPLGVITIGPDGTCKWGSIDVDQYDVSLLEIIARVEWHKLPLVPCRSKSGGLHLFLFVTEWHSAAVVQAALRAMAAKLGLGGCEILGAVQRGVERTPPVSPPVPPERKSNLWPLH